MPQTPEFQLLLYCARSEPNAECIRSVVNTGINWQKLLELAEQHGVRPMLHRSLKAVCWNSIPQSTQFELERFYLANVQRSLAFAGELLHVCREFQQSGIPIVALKGVVLAESIYGDLSLREISDLDIVVHKADMSRAEAILIARGYQADFPDRDCRSAFLSYQGQYAFHNKQTGFSIDLHWRLSGKGEAFGLNAECIWSRPEQVAMCGRMVPTLARDDLALFLAAHGTKEGWKALKWVCDFAEFLRKTQNVDWLALIDRAEQSNSCRQFQLAMFLACTLLDAPAPRELIDNARNNSAVRALAEMAQRRMLRTTPEGELRQFLNGLNTHDRLRHRLWPVATLLTTRTEGDYRAMPLPKSLWGMYYFTRPFRLAAKAAGFLVRPN
jgi:hypothetical protein